METTIARVAKQIRKTKNIIANTTYLMIVHLSNSKGFGRRQLSTTGSGGLHSTLTIWPRLEIEVTVTQITKRTTMIATTSITTISVFGVDGEPVKLIHAPYDLQPATTTINRIMSAHATRDMKMYVAFRIKI